MIRSSLGGGGGGLISKKKKRKDQYMDVLLCINNWCTTVLVVWHLWGKWSVSDYVLTQSVCNLEKKTYTLKTPGSTWPEEKKGPLGLYSVLGQKRPGIWAALCRLDQIMQSEWLTQLLVIFRVKFTDFRVIIVDWEWSFAPMDPFRVKFDRGVFRVYTGWPPQKRNSRFF